ncbi:HTH-type transcriptional regulator ArgP [Rubrivivax sp. A210]|uniref:LysR family transcriptional regulator ArgP n=1 Tax=Rubrivivax sp. A210 TaxID=2772301 RepID=UPI00191851EF|nr:LysR family transcriptional regulator ArgP [Rubrivivax sp. A210]CAD5372724.1 HTH-type transcriptional regulator ArgP [Rubrivivax sp. A210]
MLDYAALKALAAVIREGSFERAARALHVTPSAVSQRIRLLEERVGCALVVRGQPCSATETGRRLCQHVDRVRLLEQELQGALPALAREGIARVALPVAVNADSLATWFAPALAAFAAEAPVLVEVAVDDQDHTGEWLRSGAVLAAVTSTARPAAGCNSQPLGAMRYLAAASPAFVARHFAGGVGAGSLAAAPSLVFNTKDELQARWARRLCHRHVELPRHSLPSPQAFVTAALAGMGWGLQPQALVAGHLAAGRLVELVPCTPLDVALHWQHARAAAGLVEALSRRVETAARAALLPP